VPIVQGATDPYPGDDDLGAGQQHSQQSHLVIHQPVLLLLASPTAAVAVAAAIVSRHRAGHLGHRRSGGWEVADR
jgi:hypothetical protein